MLDIIGNAVAGVGGDNRAQDGIVVAFKNHVTSVSHHHPLLVADWCSAFIVTAAFLAKLATAAFVIDN